jgi:Iap family predicted aminopeptidase
MMPYDDARNVETILEVADTAKRLARRMGKEMVLDAHWREQISNHQSRECHYIELK